MNQIEFLDVIKIMVKTGEIDLGSNDAALEVVKSIKDDLEIKYRNEIELDVTGDCMHFKEAGYDSWFNFLTDANGGYEYEYWLERLFEEDELEKLWVDSHK